MPYEKESVKLNIISFNIPYPADYGGVIDVFYKIKFLHKIGVNIILHTFEYGRSHSSELNKYCEEVHYYKRKTGLLSQISFLPYIVKSRKNKSLLDNLLQNEYPILFEGLHTCYYIDHPLLRNRKKIVRTHNIEHEYYKGLADSTSELWRKIFFGIESIRLKNFERKLRFADYIISLSDIENLYFQKNFGKDKAHLIPIFHQNEKVTIREKINKPYLLFHGDLSVPENIYSAECLIENIALKNSELRLVLSGKNPDKELYVKADNIKNVEIIQNPDSKQMFDLIHNASINILYVKHPAGVKLKLLASLYTGRFCIANHAMIEGSMLRELCIIMPDGWGNVLSLIKKYYPLDFSDTEIEKRKKVLTAIYDNEQNAREIVDLLSSNN